MPWFQLPCNTNHKNAPLNLDTNRRYTERRGTIGPQCFRCVIMVIVSICARLVWCQIPEPILCYLRLLILNGYQLLHHHLSLPRVLPQSLGPISAEMHWFTVMILNMIDLSRDYIDKVVQQTVNVTLPCWMLMTLQMTSNSSALAMELPQSCAEASLMMIFLDQNWPLFFCIIVSNVILRT